MSSIVVDSWTTPGVGDYMFALNRAHWFKRALGSKNKGPMTINFHWYHDKDHLHHFEDPETIVERLDYTKNYYKNYRSLDINHIFNSEDEMLKKQRMRFSSVDRRGEITNFNVDRHMYDNTWSFRLNTYAKEDMKKVVIWRPLFNAEVPREWKRVVENDMWDNAIDILRSMGYYVVELCYRSPIREVFYHIKTCHFVMCYDGMWHYIAKNFMKPMIVTSRSTITKYHTPHAMMWHEMGNDKNLLDKLKGFHDPVDGVMFTPYQEMMKAAYDYRDYFWRSYRACKLIERS